MLAVAEDYLNAVLRRSLRRGATWAEIYQETVERQFVWLNSAGAGATRYTEAGIGLRLRVGATETYASTTDIRRLDSLVDTALAMLGHQATNSPSAVSRPPDRVPGGAPDAPVPMPAERLASLRIIKEAATAQIGSVAAEVELRDGWKNAWVADTEGHVASWQHRFSRVWARVRSSSGQTPVVGVVSPGVTGQFELFDRYSAEDIGYRAAEQAIALRSSTPVPTAVIPVVFGPGAGGTFFHEVCGHGLESDMLARRAGAYHGRLNEPIAAVSLSYTDDPLVAGVWGSYAMDDEGVAALQRPLIRDGVLVGSLHDRASTVHPGITGGHGRRQSFASPAIPRMSNTFVDAGPDSPMSVTDSVQYGLYVSDSGDGQVDPAAGLFRIGIRQGQLIRNGRLSEPVRDGVVEGSIVTALSSIDGIAADVRLVEGSCRKQSQWVNVSSGNPTMRINGLSVRPAVG